MAEPVFEKVLNNIIDKVLNNIIKEIVAVIVTATVAIILNYVSMKIYKIGIILILVALLIIYLLNKKFQRRGQLQAPDVLTKYLKKNIENKNVSDVIQEFDNDMEYLFKKYSYDTALDEIENEWLHYKEDRIKLDDFVYKLYLFLQNKSLNGKVSITKLKTKYNNFAEKIKEIIPNTSEKYPDINDDKLKEDIRKYEPNPGYWKESDDWVNKKIKKYVNKTRKMQKNNSIRILDIGTGTGRLIKDLCEENDFVCLVDYDEERLSEAKEEVRKTIKKEGQIKCIRGNFEEFLKKGELDKVGLKNNFDIIICSHVIQHNSTDVALDFYKIIYNLLLSDGMLFLLFPISKSNKEEFVVEGLEFDVVKFRRIDFFRSKKYKSVINLDYVFKEADGFDTLGVQLLNYKDNSGYWKVTKEQSEEPLYEIFEDKDVALAYKRVNNKGLICSIDTKYARDFYNKDNFSGLIGVINECLKNYTPFSELIPKESVIISSILSDYWLISDVRNNKNVMLCDECGHYIVKPVDKVIAAHGVHNYLLKKDQILPEFLNLIHGDNANLKLIKDSSKSVWNVINDSDENIASIYKTQSYYSLILTNKDVNKFNIDREELLIKQVPAVLKEKFFKGVKNPLDLIVDSEVLDGWFIGHGGEIRYYARYDSDWIKIFGTEPIFNELPAEGDLSVRDHDKFPFKLWKEENIELRPLIKDKIWKLQIKSDKKGNRLQEKFTILPSYTIIKIAEGIDKKYCAYRDKKYNGISSLTFNNLCRQQMNGLKILPTHRFIIRNLKKDLKKEGLMVKAYTLYHSFEPKESLIDKFCLRDKYLNLCILKSFKRIHKKFDIQDCMFVVKKKWINKL